ncbi:hypothetical protein P7B04_12265 [Sphingobium yanoikuyae]|uniref:hypothetical protein n=1 Tax=Sphingobium yanoikuyae TaxID=13690 RepID=UPI000B1077C4|nr:hypothetical protein [Sphingobium yanoikuyae]MDG2513471.1 hypothetical protein [Sphingobium yanoikuyae]
MSGYFLMHRGWQDNPIFDREEFSRRDAWAWLIEHAAWKPSRARIKGEMIDLDRGELCFAQRFLAEKWGWSKSRVDRFLKLLVAEGMIETRTKIGATSDHAAGQGQSIISICNYERYQAPEGIERGNVEPQNGATSGQQRTKEEEGKEYTSVSKDTSVVMSRAQPAKGHRIPANWHPSTLPPTVAQLTAQWPPGREERELDGFRDYWATRTRDAARSDWDKVWHNRIRDQHDRIMRENRNGSGTSSRGSVSEALHAARDRVGHFG